MKVSNYDLTLYQFESCPFCRRVRHFLDENDLEIEMKDTLADPAAREELRQLGGKTQVPALLIDGKIMYESNDIMDWLKENVLSEQYVS